MMKFVSWIQDFLNDPRRVFGYCICIGLIALVLDGTWYKIWNLNQDLKKLSVKSVQVDAEILNIRRQIKQANDPRFIEREARDRFDLAGQDDLVFVFAAE